RPTMELQKLHPGLRKTGIPIAVPELRARCGMGGPARAGPDHHLHPDLLQVDRRAAARYRRYHGLQHLSLRGYRRLEPAYRGHWTKHFRVPRQCEHDQETAVPSPLPSRNRSSQLLDQLLDYPGHLRSIPYRHGSLSRHQPARFATTRALAYTSRHRDRNGSWSNERLLQGRRSAYPNSAPVLVLAHADCLPDFNSARQHTNPGRLEPDDSNHRSLPADLPVQQRAGMEFPDPGVDHRWGNDVRRSLNLSKERD